MTTHLDQACLIDVSEEDDSLLPIGDEATHRNLHSLTQTGYTERNAEGNAAIHEKLPVSHDSLCTPEEPVSLALPVSSEDSDIMKKKKKKFGFNVRKSLAWNDAFLTEEGVLDSEELSLVNKTFQKPPGPSKQSNLRKPTTTLKLRKPPMMPKILVTSHKLESKENMIIPALSSCCRSTEKLSDQPTNISGLDEMKLKDDSSLSLGTTVISEQEKPNKITNAAPSAPKLSPLSGAIHKDQRFLLPVPNLNTSKGGTQPKHVIKDSRPIANLEARRRSSTKLSMERLSSTVTTGLQPAPSSLKIQSGLSASANMLSDLKKSSQVEGPRASTSRDKPSGLRMPSPKLGFFDTSKSSSQVAVLREKTNGHSYGGFDPGSSKTDQLEAQISGSKSSIRQFGHSATSAKFNHQLPQASRNQSKGISTTQVHRSYAEFASLPAAPAHEGSAPLSSTDTTERVLQARTGGQSAVICGKPDIQCVPATLRTRGRENFSPNGNKGRGMPCSKAQGQVLRKLSIKSGNICASGGKMHAGHTENILSAAQNSASQVLSSSACQRVD